MFCGLTQTLGAFYNYFMGAKETLKTEEHRGIIEKINRMPEPEPLPLSDEEPIEVNDEITCQIKLVDGFEFEITATEDELDILKVRQPVQVIYYWDQNKLQMPQATEVHPLVQTNFEIKTWSEVLNECDIDYNTMVRVSTNPDQPLKLEFM